MPDEEWIGSVAVRFGLDAAKQRELDQLLEELHRPGSPNFRRWLKPEDFASRFGLATERQAMVERWLTSAGMQVDYRARTGMFFLVSGTARAVRRAFLTDLRRYEINGRRHFASTSAPVIPRELASFVQHVDGLDDFVPTTGARPDYNLPNGRHLLAPDDYATIYNIRPAIDRGLDGSDQRIVVVGQSRIEVSDMLAFRSRFNLPAAELELIQYPSSNDPGLNSSSRIEANLDLQWAGAIARRAKLIYVFGTSAISAASYAIDRNLAPIISVSFSAGCEAQNPQATLSALRTTVQTANALGITWVNSAGDAGAGGCEINSAPIVQSGYGPRFPAVIPEVTAVGGTELNDRNGTYWRATNDANLASAISYIPEIPWNQSVQGISIAAGGSGISQFFERPPWQVGAGLDGQPTRRTPDISLAASTYNGYSIIYNNELFVVGGTSAGTPAFAAMLALVLQATNQTGLGNVNRFLYPLAQSNPEAFHDVTEGDTLIPCVVGTKDCDTGRIGYTAGPGYDMATGLGTIDFDRFLAAWPRTAPTRAMLTLSTNRNPIYRTNSAAGTSQWTFGFALKEHAGVAVTISSFKIGTTDFSARITELLGRNTIGANQLLSTNINLTNLPSPVTLPLELSGRDELGNDFTLSVPLNIEGPAPAPVISGIAHGASFANSFAPGGIMSVFGSNLANRTQAAGAVPLVNFSGGVFATINGEAAPFYFVSPGQINLQIPYTARPGPARLIISYPQAGSASFDFQLQANAPGIFTNGDLFTVPQTSCSRGETCILYVTGHGSTRPGIATGNAPGPNTLLVDLPRPDAPISMTIGDTPASIVFAGTPPGLVGLIQVNFTVNPSTPTGTQPVVVRIGSADSVSAKIQVR